MDEPLSNLDAKLRVQMRADIAKLQREIGTTTIYVTHDQVEAMTMGDRVAVMNFGELQQVDSPQRLYDEPANLFVAGFIGTPPMNLLEATVIARNGDFSFALGEQQLPLTPGALARYPGARARDGQQVVVGIRPGHLLPPRSRPDLPTVEARLDLVEALGSESMVYFRIEAPTVRPAGAYEEEEAEPAGEGVTATRPNLVAAFPPDARLTLGERVPLAVDVDKLHFFDRESGAPLR